MATAEQVKPHLATVREAIEDEYDLEEHEDIAASLDALEQFVSGHGNGHVNLDPKSLANYGQKLNRRDLNDKRLRIGDEVRVHDSCTYGSPEAIVVGEAFGVGHKGPRVHVRVKPGGQDYKPSQGRVERLVRAKTAE